MERKTQCLLAIWAWRLDEGCLGRVLATKWRQDSAQGENSEKQCYDGSLKGLQWPIRECNERVFPFETGFKSGRCRTLTVFRPFRTGRQGGGFPGLKPWAKSLHHFVAKSSQNILNCAPFPLIPFDRPGGYSKCLTLDNPSLQNFCALGSAGRARWLFGKGFRTLLVRFYPRTGCSLRWRLEGFWARLLSV
jgi:hypothetical protein